MYPNSDNNPTAAADAASMRPVGGDISLYARKSVDYNRQMVWSPQPQQYYYPSGYQQHQQQRQFQSPPRGSYSNPPTYLSFSTPREQSEPPTSPPKLRQSEGIGGIGASSGNLLMMSSVDETSSPVMETPSNRKMMILTAAASSTEEGSVIAERREEVVDGRAQNDDFMSRVASPTQNHNLPLKKRKAISKESMLSMEIDKLKADLGKAELKIKVLEEENERLRQQQQEQQHRDTARSSFDVSNASKGQLPFIPDLPSNNATTSPGKGAISQINQHEKHKHHMMKQQQQLHSIYRVPSSSDQQLPIPQDAFIQSHHQDIGRPVPYHPHPYPTTPPTTSNFDHHQHQQQQRSQHIHRDRRDWVRPPNNNHVDNNSSGASPESHKKISFALSFDANTKSGDPRGYNRCVSNRGRGSRPPLASRWKSR